MMDIQNIEDFEARLHREDMVNRYREMIQNEALPEPEEQSFNRSPDCPTLVKDQEKLSMFYAGKKRRKGGRYA